MSTPLNLCLYTMLQKEFGRVLISNEGEAMVAAYGKRYDGDGEQLNVVSTGEQYRVCCPRCTDTRFRLYFAHAWGVEDERGNRNYWMMYCQNTHSCWSEYRHRTEMRDRLQTISDGLARTVIRPGKPITQAGPTHLPGPHFPLHTLSPTHSANRYLLSRFYDTDVLSKYYRVGYCPESPMYLARNRIVAPIFMHGKLRGWQARVIGELDWKAEGAPPKWWSDPRMKKSLVLYNYDNAIRFRTGVVVEGPSSAWGFGAMAMATMGSSVSMPQIDLLKKGFESESLVWLWDPDVRHDPMKMKHLMKMLPHLEKAFRKGFAVVWLPDGSDPGTLDRNYMRDYVAREAKAQGVTVDWRHR